MFFFYLIIKGLKYEIKIPGVWMQGFRNFKDQIRNSHFQPQNITVSIRHGSSSTSLSTESLPAKKERKMWNPNILVLSKHRRAIFIFMMITTPRDKNWTLRPSPSRNRLPQPCLSGGEMLGWGRRRLISINTQQSTKQMRRKKERKKEKQREKKKVERRKKTGETT